MDFLKGQLDKIQQQLGGLNASQKMLTGSLIAIMVMTLVWWGRYASTAEMEPLLPQSFSDADVTKIQRQLKASSIPSKVSGDQVLVPADKRDEALAALALGDGMPENTASGFDEISKKSSPWDPQSKTEALYKEAKQITLRNVIRKMDGVLDATVLLEPAGARRLGSENQASASVYITMKDRGTGNRKLADAVANLVAGAQQHLKVSNVRVVIGQRRYQIKGDDDGIDGSDSYGELVAAHERRLEEKVAGLYPYIDGLFVKIAVTVNMTSSQVQSKTVDPNVIQKEKRLNTRNESEPVPMAAAAEPGGAANMGATIDPPLQAQIAGEKTVEESDTEFENFAGTKSETLLKPAGDPTVLSAAVRVPRSYFLKAYKSMSGSASEPALLALQPVIDAESEKIRNEVVSCTAIGDVSKVVVTMYDDSPASVLVGANAAPPSTITQSLSSYGKEIALGALAVISLFMVSMMVRKSTPAPVIAVAPAPRETPHLNGGSEIAGFVGEGDQMLDAMELDEDAVRTQQMLDQVSTLVGENPDAAANLVKRWLNRT